MNKSNQKTMQQILTQIEEMLKMIETHQGPIKQLPDAPFVNAQSEVYEKFIDHMAELCDSLKDPETSPPPQLDEDTKQLLLKAKALENEAKAFEKAFAQAREKNKRKGKSKKGEKNAAGERQKKERRKLFKTIGGDKKWIPL